MCIPKCRGLVDCLTPAERAICDAWDNGQSIDQIARARKMPRHDVRDVISRLDGSADARRERAMMQSGSAAMRAALHRAYAERIAA
jgi:hypothetical protein